MVGQRFSAQFSYSLLISELLSHISVLSLVSLIDLTRVTHTQQVNIATETSRVQQAVSMIVQPVTKVEIIHFIMQNSNVKVWSVPVWTKRQDNAPIQSLHW